MTKEQKDFPVRLFIPIKKYFFIGIRYFIILFGTAILLSGCLLIVGRIYLGPLNIDKLSEKSVIILDRKGDLLRAFVTEAGRWRLPVDLQKIDPRFIEMLILAEDKRFYSHWGIDPFALSRASFQALIYGKVVSGASTLEMQVARLLEPREKRDLFAKLRQMIRAIQLSRKYTKEEILSFYFQLAPYGGNIEGIRAASIIYFGREPEHLSLSEAALLVALPQSPEIRRPDRFPQRARTARNRILDRLIDAGFIDERDAELAKNQDVPKKRRAFPALAPHLTEHLVRQEPHKKVFTLTLDRELQKNLEIIAKRRVNQLGDRTNIALVVLDNATGELRASVGSSDYHSKIRKGANDMTLAIRSPGSALKPFIYAMAFEQGLAHPETLLEDRRVRYGTYAPENFDSGFKGIVSAREALQLSLNIPVIDLLSEIGPVKFIGRLREAGAQIELPENTIPGLAVGLGGLGISLIDLTRLYSGFARGGEVLPLKVMTNEKKSNNTTPKFITEKVAAWYIWDILKDSPPPDTSLGGVIAFKTGTSYGYRDAVAIGFDRRYTVGVWVGRADGEPVPDILGRKSAAPVVFDAFASLGGTLKGLPRPTHVLQVKSASQLPPPLVHTRKDIAKRVDLTSKQALRITYPIQGTTIDLGLSDSNTKETLLLQAHGGVAPVRWLVNGVSLGTPDMSREAFWEPDGEGFVRISVIDSTGSVSSIVVRIQ